MLARSGSISSGNPSEDGSGSGGSSSQVNLDDDDDFDDVVKRSQCALQSAIIGGVDVERTGGTDFEGTLRAGDPASPNVH